MGCCFEFVVGVVYTTVAFRWRRGVTGYDFFYAVYVSFIRVFRGACEFRILRKIAVGGIGVVVGSCVLRGFWRGDGRRWEFSFGRSFFGFRTRAGGESVSVVSAR